MSNKIAIYLLYVGVGIIIIGFFIGAKLGADSNSFIPVFIGILCSIFFGSIFIGLSEIIELLHKQIDKDKKQNNKNEIQN